MSELRDVTRAMQELSDSVSALEEYAARADGHFEQLRLSNHDTNNHLAAVKLMGGEHAGQLDGHTRAIQELQFAVGSLSDQLARQHVQVMKALGKDPFDGQSEAGRRNR